MQSTRIKYVQTYMKKYNAYIDTTMHRKTHFHVHNSTENMTSKHTYAIGMHTHTHTHTVFIVSLTGVFVPLHTLTSVDSIVPHKSSLQLCN